MEKSKFNVLLVMTMMVASMEFHGSVAREIIVGDAFGWAVPSGAFFYPWWASHQTFETNDVLVFNFTTPAHNVAVVTRTEYDTCEGSNPMALYTKSPARIIINSKMQPFFISTIGSDCKKFMKLALS